MPQLGKPPARNELSAMADFAELACLLEVGGTYDGTLLVDALKEVDELEPSPPGVAEDAEFSEAHAAEADDGRFRVSADVWLHLEARAEAFGASYPFEVDTEARELLTVAMTDLRRTYAACLLASQLSRMTNAERAELTKAFERISRHAIGALMPSSASVWVFGTAATAGPFARGNLQARLGTLAERLGAQVLEDAAALSPYNSGDGGLDIVGLADMEGPSDRRLVVFGQCACGENWPAKQSEVALDTWRGRLSLRGALAPVTLIPRDYRDVAGAWQDAFALNAGNVLVDRRRFLQLIAAAENDPFVDLPGVVGALPGFQDS